MRRARGRGGMGAGRFVSDLLTLAMAATIIVILVATGGWRTVSTYLGVGDPDATILPHVPAPASDNATVPDKAPTSDGWGAPEEIRQARSVLDQIRTGEPHPSGYDREKRFGGWQPNGCGRASTRDTILARDLTDATRDDQCRVTSGILHDPYTGRDIRFQRGAETSQMVQIDHVVSLYDAWASGAWQWGDDKRIRYANSPDVLQASDGPSNMAKGAGIDLKGHGQYARSGPRAPDIWLPDNTGWQCSYMARRVLVKNEWSLSMTVREKRQTAAFLDSCPT